jgi:hypothetical protein
VAQDELHTEGTPLKWGCNRAVDISVNFSDAVVFVTWNIFDAFGGFSCQFFQFLWGKIEKPIKLKTREIYAKKGPRLTLATWEIT